MRRGVWGVAGAVVISIGCMGHAAAGPPIGSASTCPGKYHPMTRDQIHAQAASLGISQEMADGAFDSVNHNGDAWICQKGTPPGEPGFNWTDNNSRGQGR